MHTKKPADRIGLAGFFVGSIFPYSYFKNCLSVYKHRVDEFG